jgi:hypothetical protein
VQEKEKIRKILARKILQHDVSGGYKKQHETSGAGDEDSMTPPF